ncbi:MAG TPA: magnesium transporter CorA family protein [Dermatophilaceae bacterium]|nr:magnesium transporter CorA family protein [Dermatophilaceae bacterium]
MQVSYVTVAEDVDGSPITDHDPALVETLLQRTDGFVWVDIEHWDEQAYRLLKETFHCHSLVLDACARMNHVPTIHAYPAHVFVTLFVPLTIESGRVHRIELDQIIGERYLVTVHGPYDGGVNEDEATREVDAVRYRIVSGRFHPTRPSQLSYAVGSAMARRQQEAVGQVAQRLPALEAEVMSGDLSQPEKLLERLFLLRHELLVVRTMAAQSYDMYARIESLKGRVSDAHRGYAKDLAKQFERVKSVADGELDFLFGIIDLYQTRVTTKMTIAMERLAVIAAITLPVTALASVYGMNVIVNQTTHVGQLVGVLAVMLAISGVLLRWTKRQGWW